MTSGRPIAPPGRLQQQHDANATEHRLEWKLEAEKVGIEENPLAANKAVMAEE